ncbi:hypothetical protein [Tuberibacillus sp. Marseille-P3662]|uniref:hypothetical protein n=1 Tax=Tuberibacillus sp. Marseille-P3662 TaxID=1965358 RepID=UPI000A1CA498|nr:hypothetical protein [Tuberibacillus sp. Marseille-P3662]
MESSVISQPFADGAIYILLNSARHNIHKNMIGVEKAYTKLYYSLWIKSDEVREINHNMNL